ncbi:hypothetical protein [Shewanella canadensis]|uniref:hypothetical protein n=1 Tax=Shewanella canadensis TaxID=271096 RepID=UPI00163B5664|nr:hypothetical protein [Shewanella canadensis]
MSSTAEEEKSLKLKIFSFLTVFLAPLVSVLLGFSSLVAQAAPFQYFSPDR